MWKHGFGATGVDWVGNKHKTVIPILKVDLTIEAGQQIVLDLLQQPDLRYIHMGFPRGTFTRAREMPIPEWQKERGAPVPRPLRTDAEPAGLPKEHLTPNEQIKVVKGNQIAVFCDRIANICIENKIGFTIENPTGSILWLLPEYVDLAKRPEAFFVPFHACVWGSKRKKRTSLLTNIQAMKTLEKYCPGESACHKHLPWGLRWHKRWKFATEEECEYPEVLCDAIASRAEGAAIPQSQAAQFAESQRASQVNTL